MALILASSCEFGYNAGGVQIVADTSSLWGNVAVGTSLWSYADADGTPTPGAGYTGRFALRCAAGFAGLELSADLWPANDAASTYFTFHFLFRVTARSFSNVQQSAIYNRWNGLPGTNEGIWGVRAFANSSTTFSLRLINKKGTTVTEVGTDSAGLTMADLHWVALSLRKSDKAARLHIDGTLLQDWVTHANVTNLYSTFCPWSEQYAGKGTTENPLEYTSFLLTDDLDDGTPIVGLLGTAYKNVMVSQPFADVTGLLDFTRSDGTKPHYCHWDDANDNEADPGPGAGDKLTRVAFGKQLSTFSAIPTGTPTPTVEGVVIWDEGASTLTARNKVFMAGSPLRNKARTAIGMWFAAWQKDPDNNLWTRTNFNDNFRAGVEDLNYGNFDTFALYAICVGQNLLRPAKTPAGNPTNTVSGPGGSFATPSPSARNVLLRR